MNGTYRRGELYYADLETGVGSEQRGPRPVIIIQNNTGNRHSPTVIVAAVTSWKPQKPPLPTHFRIGAEAGLDSPSIALTEQLRTLDKQRLGDYIGQLDEEQTAKLDHALAVSLALERTLPTSARAVQKSEEGSLTMALCGRCAANFRDTGAYILKRADPGQTEKDTCTYCGQRRGYDYEVSAKTKRRK